MIQAQGSYRRPGGMIPLLLIVSILCMLAGELACGSACQTMPQRFPCAVCQTMPQRLSSAVCRQETVQLLTDMPEEITQNAAAAAAGARSAVWNDAASAFGKGASSRAFRTVVFLAGFLCVGGFPVLSSRKCLLAFLYEEKPDRARFLRELFIQKKKDGKKRLPLPAAEG